MAEGFSIFVILILLLTLPAFLPLLIKVPKLPNRYGVKPLKIGFFGAIGAFFKNYFNFKGRASRGEYWWFYLASIIVNILIIAIAAVAGYALVGEDADKVSEILTYISNIYSLILAIGFISLTVRRLHDINRSRWWVLIGFGIGVFVLIYMHCQPSDPDPTKPKVFLEAE